MLELERKLEMTANEAITKLEQTKVNLGNAAKSIKRGRSRDSEKAMALADVKLKQEAIDLAITALKAEKISAHTS